MTANENMHDRAIRMVLGVVIASIGIYANTFWAILGLIPFVTGIVGICPLYKVLGINTNKA